MDEAGALLGEKMEERSDDSKYARRANEGQDFRKIGGLLRRIIHPETIGSENVAMGIGYVNPGEELLRHRHTYEEMYYYLQGRGTMIVGDAVLKAESGLFVYVPPNVPHHTINTGDEPMVLLYSYWPPAAAGDQIVLITEDGEVPLRDIQTSREST